MPSSPDHQIDYFTIVPPAYTHFSTETPCQSPTAVFHDVSAYAEHPLLAYTTTFEPGASSPRMAHNLMSMQTSAAYGQSRPKAYPVQNVLHVTSDDSTSSASSKSSMESTSSLPELARCSRCQRTPSVDIKTGHSNMIAYGLNLWYCSRCASIVGFKR